MSAANRGRGQPLRAVCPRNVVRLFRPKGRNWMPRINSGHPTVRLPQTEAWAKRERVPSGHNCRRQLATDRPEQIQGPGTAVPGTPIFANYAQRGGPPLESPCRLLSLVLSFAPKESTIPRRGGSPTVRAGVGASVPTGRRPAPAGAPKGFPRGKQSARFALPCAPLVVCLNDRSLTAFGGCIHWIPASLRSPLETFGARKLAGFPCRAASPIPRP